MLLSYDLNKLAIRGGTVISLAIAALSYTAHPASALSLISSKRADPGAFLLAQGTPWQSAPDPQVALPPSYSTWPTYQQPSGPEPYNGGDPELARVQDALRHFGYATGPSDGRWGPRTAEAARRYLRDRGYDPSRMTHDEMRTLILAEAAGVRPGD